jgi:hypothetical protein
MIESPAPLRGLIFDLDGTLVDSRLDFEAMRREMELPAGTPILEALEDLPAHRAERCREILHRHEQEGARRATPLPGALSLVAELKRRGLRLGVITRNSRPLAEAMLAHFPEAFDPVISRAAHLPAMGVAARGSRHGGRLSIRHRIRPAGRLPHGAGSSAGRGDALAGGGPPRLASAVAAGGGPVAALVRGELRVPGRTEE